LLSPPPVVRGQAGAGEEPGLAAAVGALVADGLGRAVALGLGDTDDAGVGLTDRVAEAAGLSVGEERASGCGPHALTTTMPRARASAA
jgi:hypothetical protein